MGTDDVVDVAWLVILVAFLLVIFIPGILGFLSGNVTLTEYLTPSWEGFAQEKPMLFAWVVVIGVLIFGSRFARLLEVS